MKIHSSTEYWAISSSLLWPPLSKLNHNIQSFLTLAFTPFTHSKEQPVHDAFLFHAICWSLKILSRKGGSYFHFTKLETHRLILTALFLTSALEDTDWFASSRSWWSMLLCFHHRNKEINAQGSTGSKRIEADGFQLPRSHPSPVRSLLQELPRSFTFDNSNCDCSKALKCWEQRRHPSYHVFHSSWG